MMLVKTMTTSAKSGRDARRVVRNLLDNEIIEYFRGEGFDPNLKVLGSRVAKQTSRSKLYEVEVCVEFAGCSDAVFTSFEPVLKSVGVLL